jgi:hypothetical protein
MILLQVLANALQFHPTSAGLWSHAAAWEMQHHGNATAARVLMQRGLRLVRLCFLVVLYSKVFLVIASKMIGNDFYIIDKV